MKDTISTNGSGRPRPPGVSFNVLDTCWNYRLMRTFECEGVGQKFGRGHGRVASIARARELAEQYADRLEKKYAL